MGMLFGGGGGSSAPPPPPPPPPPPNPPTYATSIFAPPAMNPASIYGGLSSTVLSSPLGAQDQRATQRKTLLGQ